MPSSFSSEHGQLPGGLGNGEGCAACFGELADATLDDAFLDLTEASA
ncbi:hypothetical protein ABZ281_40540 [Streptomyces sp. NPDC006265]